MDTKDGRLECPNAPMISNSGEMNMFLFKKYLISTIGTNLMKQMKR